MIDGNIPQPFMTCGGASPRWVAGVLGGPHVGYGLQIPRSLQIVSRSGEPLVGRPLESRPTCGHKHAVRTPFMIPFRGIMVQLRI